jgi:hypothetical protein
MMPNDGKMNPYRDWTDVAFGLSLFWQDDEITFTPTLFQLALLRELRERGGRARPRYWNAGAQVRDLFFREGLIFLSHERGENWCLLSPYGAAVLVKYADISTRSVALERLTKRRQTIAARSSPDELEA